MVNKLKAKTDTMWPRMLGEFEKEELTEGTDCIFPRKEVPALTVVNISEQGRKQSMAKGGMTRSFSFIK